MDQVTLDHNITREELDELLRRGGFDPNTYDNVGRRKKRQDLYMELKNRDAKLVWVEKSEHQGIVRHARSSKLLVHTPMGYVLEEGRKYDKPYVNTMPWTFSGCQHYPRSKEELEKMTEEERKKEEETPLDAIVREVSAETKTRIRVPVEELTGMKGEPASKVLPVGTFRPSKAYYGIWSAVLVHRYKWVTKRKILTSGVIHDKGVDIPVGFYEKIPEAVDIAYLASIIEYERVFGRINSPNSPMHEPIYGEL